MVCVVNARRIKARTITILVKDVIITKRLGRIASPPKMITSLTGVDQSLSVPLLAVALSITVIKSAMFGMLFAGATDPEVSPGSFGTPVCSGGKAGNRRRCVKTLAKAKSGRRQYNEHQKKISHKLMCYHILFLVSHGLVLAKSLSGHSQRRADHIQIIAGPGIMLLFPAAINSQSRRLCRPAL